jgi:hypothetical protein
MKRDDETKWGAARSWFGGLPPINPNRWPRASKTGLPLHHLASIDLSEVPRGKNTPALPESGILSFFADTGIDTGDLDVGVLFTDTKLKLIPSNPPADCPPLYGDNWSSYCRGAASVTEAPRAYRRWPIEFSFVASVGISYPSLERVISGLGPRPESIHIFTTTKLDHTPDGVFPWDAVRRIVNGFQYSFTPHEQSRTFVQYPGAKQSTPEEHERQWQVKDRQMDDVRHFIKHWSHRLEGRDPFNAIGPIMAAQLENDFKALSFESKHKCRYGRGTSPIRDAASDVYRDMVAGPIGLFERIPAEIREYLSNERRKPGWNKSGLHQMFGLSPSVQQDPVKFGEEILLFSAASDDMLSWLWGDVGLINFRISPENLSSQKWDKVWGLFEGH